MAKKVTAVTARQRNKLFQLFEIAIIVCTCIVCFKELAAVASNSYRRVASRSASLSTSDEVETDGEGEEEDVNYNNLEALAKQLLALAVSAPVTEWLYHRQPTQNSPSNASSRSKAQQRLPLPQLKPRQSAVTQGITLGSLILPGLVAATLLWQSAHTATPQQHEQQQQHELELQMIQAQQRRRKPRRRRRPRKRRLRMQKPKKRTRRRKHRLRGRVRAGDVVGRRSSNRYNLS